jgi:hypothetical protein
LPTPYNETFYAFTACSGCRYILRRRHSQVCSRDIDTDNPSDSDPENPPSTLNRPVVNLDNPFAGKSITVPDSCNDLQRPSDQCLRDIKAGKDEANAQSGGGLTFEKDSQCSDDQKGILETAAYEALTLATFAAHNPSSAREIATWKAYIGPDYANQQGRITGTGYTFRDVIVASPVLHTNAS